MYELFVFFFLGSGAGPPSLPAAAVDDDTVEEEALLLLERRLPSFVLLVRFLVLASPLPFALPAAPAGAAPLPWPLLLAVPVAESVLLLSAASK